LANQIENCEKKSEDMLQLQTTIFSNWTTFDLDGTI